MSNFITKYHVMPQTVKSWDCRVVRVFQGKYASTLNLMIAVCKIVSLLDQ